MTMYNFFATSSSLAKDYRSRGRTCPTQPGVSPAGSIHIGHAYAVLWGRLETCGPIGNRPARRLPTAAQLTKLPHITAIALLLSLLLASCMKPAPLPVLGAVPPFQLTAQSGLPFDSSSLAGHIWVADFIYTTCPGPCPMMSSQMRRLQVSTAEIPDVRLVSFTVDPAHDTPEVLTAYARHFLAEPARWSFLTGDPATLDRLGLDAFHLNSVDGSLIHSTRFALVDRRSRIRAYYMTDEDSFMTKLLHDIRQLERETS